MSAAIESRLIAAGVRNLKKYGYPSVNAENIMSDYVYRSFFAEMLRGTIGQSPGDPGIKFAAESLLKRCDEAAAGAQP